ncbi:hypothetical protein RBH26_11615 [Natronolimnohabitans sp. A-GB9]|uniref:hypothetical protein n=1 Tax=Natronolimnohabitans sp. A-GB9 TaxID=3069757 RepID=UPI0027B09035|nr:hypothetical protein [Natronolimnohabitans sp. A-GB9]MDQ2051129.1 hypothetical protein [Natronolimnohabitans sp. A-GB9]
MEITNMSMNRRNVLVGLGTIVAGGGAALGTGAFSSVEADRDVTVETAGDGSAYLEMEGDDDYVTDGGGDDDTLELDLGGPDGDSGFNRDATTVVEGIVTLRNNAADGTDIEVGFGETGDLDDSTQVTVNDGDGNVADVEFYFDDLDDGTTPTVEDNDEAHLNAKIEVNSDTDIDDSAEITIVAEETAD